MDFGRAGQDEAARAGDLIDPALRSLSCEQRARKPSERLFRHTLISLLRDEPRLTIKLIDGVVLRIREVQRRAHVSA